VLGLGIWEEYVKMKYNETEKLELKKSTSELRDGIKSICAILNKHQKGKLIFGIKPDGEVVGQQVGANTLRDISQQIANSIETRIYPEVCEEKIECKDCIVVEFDGLNVPYYAYGRAYVRVSDEDRLLSAKELERLILDKNKDRLRWDSEICEGASLEDIDEDLISKFVELTKESKRINIKGENKELILKKLNLIVGSKITNAGILLFGREPSKFFVNNLVKCGRFKGVTKEEFIDMKDFGENLFDSVENVISFLKGHLRIGAKIKGLLREEKWEIPIDALREAVINSVIHRNYFDSSFIYVKMYDSKIVIANPGELPEPLEIEDLYKEHESKLRNPLLARVFYYAGFIDSWGRGSLNIINALKEEGLDKPIFEESGGSFRIIFNRVENVIDGVTGQLSGQLSGQLNELLSVIRTNPGLNLTRISDSLNKPFRTVDKQIKKLGDKKLIERRGSKKTGGYYEK